MIQKIIMPSGGQTTDEMLILKWYKVPGDVVSQGDLLFEIETDKATLSVESFTDGTLLAVRYKDGEMVRTGEIVAYIGNPGDIIPEEKEQESAPLKKDFVPEKSTETIALNIEHNRIFASPLAKSKARQEKIKLEDIADHFSKKIIKKSDIDNYIRDIHTESAGEGFYLFAATPMRKAIARRMKESVASAPHYIVSVDIDMTEIVSLRQQLNEYAADKNLKISYNDILMKIVAQAIKHFPLINSSFQEDKIKVFNDINFGLAVSLENGLIVPVVQQVNKKSIEEISSLNAENITKTINNKLLESDITGGTITLSNLGMLGINNFTAIINQPESCILAVGAIIEKPVVKDHKIVIREIMNITGSFDHRVIDGAYGGAFLKKIREFAENPGMLFFTPEKYLTER